ncbi:hypothetical protein QNH46_19825 [Paenibacillus woosongensis]|uniref:Uncharacterized protein n=1 Tax=Paenibacillus woosongensis TaxID=307580 RepID=A0AA95L1C7_9BACL|nr:hypothetical protein [Paenibacillus woosongensis]WHX48326.1 hypothetical protein QNH46_19825 [Paenibacillus woosongensis]
MKHSHKQQGSDHKAEAQAPANQATANHDVTEKSSFQLQSLIVLKQLLQTKEREQDEGDGDTGLVGSSVFILAHIFIFRELNGNHALK